MLLQMSLLSFGVVLLELLTGMHPISHGKNIVREVNNAFRSGMMFSVIDKRMGSYPSECVERFLSLALKCCQENTDSRLSMTEVVHELKFRTSSTFSIYDAPLVS